MFASKDDFLPKVFGLKLNGRSVSVRRAPAISYFEDMNIPGAAFCVVNHEAQGGQTSFNQNNDSRVIRSH